MIAINAVLLPSPQLSHIAIDLSNRIKNTSPFTLNIVDRLPHISLVMGYTDDTISAISAIRKISKKTGPIELRVAGIHRYEPSFAGKYFFEIRLETSKKILDVQNELLKTLPLVRVEHPSQEAFIRDGDEIIDPAVLDYVGNFKNRSGDENLVPHITIGAAEKDSSIDDVKLPSTITIPQITLCQLGNYCTCRNIIG